MEQSTTANGMELVRRLLEEAQAKDLDTLQTEIEKTERDIRCRRKEDREVICQTAANLFCQRFFLELTQAIDKMVEAEKRNPPDPEGRLHYWKSRFRGLVRVFEIENVFIGRFNDDKFSPPAWLKLVTQKLEEKGFSPQVKVIVDGDMGGNQRLVYFCIPDPRVNGKKS